MAHLLKFWFSVLLLLLLGHLQGSAVAPRAASHLNGAGDWPAVRNADNSGASALLGGRLTTPTLIAQYELPKFIFYPGTATVNGTPKAAAETGWGQQARPATQDFDGDGKKESIQCENKPEQIKVKVVSADDQKVLWEQEISMKNRPELFLSAPIIADVHPDLPGDEAIFFGNWIDKPRKAAMKIEGDDGFFGYICCVSYAGGKGRIVWENEQERITYSPGIIIDDVDEDGIKDIIVSVHYRLFIINGKTGKTTHDVHFSHGRNYALVQTFQRKGDPLKKIVISGDFYEESTVIDLFRKPDGTVGARALWTMLFDDTVGLKRVVTYSMQQMVQDLKGNGEPQLLLNFFNVKDHPILPVGGFDNPLGDTNGDGICDGVNVIGKEPFYVKGDGKWHVLALDPLTGRVQQSVTGQWFDGAGDLNGDGRPELFMRETFGQVHPGYSQLSLWGQKNDKLKKLWTAPDKRGRFVKANIGFRPYFTANSMNNGIILAADLDNDSRMEFFILSDTDNDWNADRLECFTAAHAGGKLSISRKWTYDNRGASLDVAVVKPAAGQSDVYDLFVSDRRHGGRMYQLDSATGKEKSPATPWTEPGGPANPQTVAGDFDGDGKMEIVLSPNTCETQVLKYHPDTSTFTEQLRLPGHGLYALNPLVADLDGDNKSEFILGQPGPHGEIQIAAFTITGKKLWATPIENITFSPYGDRSPGSLDGTPIAADFNGDGIKDVFFAAFRDGQGGKESFALDGKNGRLLWHMFGLPGHDKTGDYAMLGTRDMVAHVDINGDKREEILLCSTFFPQIVEGATGKILSPHMQVDEAFQIGTASAAYFSPVVADVDGDGHKDIYWFGGGRYHVLTDLNLKKKWDILNHTVGLNGAAVEAVGRLQATGPMHIVFTGTLEAPKYSGNVVWNEADNTRLICLNGADGKTAWTWRPANKESFKTNPVLADLDGDKLHEAIVMVGADLYAIKAPAAGQSEPTVLWVYHLPQGHPSPANVMVVDADGDGNPEIMLAGTSGSNGKLYLLGESTELGTALVAR